jgi:hypothetical protein
VTSKIGCALLLLAVPLSAAGETLQEQREALFATIARVHEPSPEQQERLREIFAASPVIGQGNPAITRHPMDEAECRERADAAPDAEAERLCGGVNMAPLYDPATETPADARACIDRFEFPNVACAYPVVWVRAREAAQICAALDKRLCDAHEWEGACDGALEAPDYRFDLARGVGANEGVRRMRAAHNQAYAGAKRWSYGPEPRKGVCAAASRKSEACEGGSWKHCGSNTYPAGAFPECQSPLGVYDLNGNAAEHMNLPLDESQLASRGSTELGVTEMKGSWFIFDHYHAHEDWCRWRAPYWHGGRVMASDSHHNYHLGFRCCRSLPEPAPQEVSRPDSP